MRLIGSPSPGAGLIRPGSVVGTISHDAARHPDHSTGEVIRRRVARERFRLHPQSHTPRNCCVRFAATVAGDHATLATKRALPLTWTASSTGWIAPACLAHSLNHLVGSGQKRFGDVRPSALAVFVLMTSSNLVARCTGRSAGFSPLRMRAA